MTLKKHALIPFLFQSDSSTANLQELYKRTSSIEAHCVASDVLEATELEGRQAANHLEKEQNKKRKWRRTGMKNISSDFRDALWKKRKTFYNTVTWERARQISDASLKCEMRAFCKT